MKKILAAIGIIAIMGLGSYSYTALTEDVVITTITNKDRECDSSGKTCRYVIYTKENAESDGEVMENVDSYWYLKFNSSDYYNNLEVGKEYRLTLYGLRVPFMSWYRNIVDYEKLN